MNDLKSLLDSNTLKLGTYLDIKSGGVYEIPFSQRQYEWGKEEVNRILNDFIALFEGSEELHPLNFFTLSKKDDETLSIYDGQQRTVTCLLILAFISQKLSENGDIEAASQIQREYFVTKDNFEDDKTVHKIKFDDKSDTNFFYEITKLKNSSDTTSEFSKDIKYLHKNSNKRALSYNYELISNYINEYFSEYHGNDLVKGLHKLFTVITNNSFLIELVAYDENVASSMFESLNNTGKSLEKYYVLKNDIVKCIGEKDVRDPWMNIEGNLSDLSHSRYLNALATILNGKTTGPATLKAIYKYYDISNGNDNSKQNAHSLLRLLKATSHNYLEICNTSQFIDKNNKSEVSRYRKLSNYISILGFKQHIPLLLSMMVKNKSTSDINKVLWAVIVLCVRNFLFDGEKTNTIEKPFADYSKDIFNDKLTVDELINGIYKFAKNDSIIKPKIMAKDFSSSRASASAKIILIMLYNKALIGDETGIKTDEVDLEHILPRKPKSESKWMSDFSNYDRRVKYTNSIGNLTLWVKGKNRSAKNAEFSEKRSNYKDSTLKENKEIANNDKWTSKEIKTRTSYLAEDILELFSVK